MDKLSTSSRINALLHEMGIFSFYQVVEHIPRRYEFIDYSSEKDIKNKERITIYGKVVTPLNLRKGNKVKSVSFSVNCPSLHRTFNVVAFNREYLAKTISQGDDVTLWGIYEEKFNQINLINLLKGEIDEENRIRPIYSLIEGLDNHTYIRIVNKALKELEDKIYSSVPYYYQNKYSLMNKYYALKALHQPHYKEDIHQALRHLKYEEALMFSLQNKIIHEENKSLSKIKKEPIDIDICTPFIDNLPFSLTKEQLKSAQEIILDMNENTLMYRLLQGDVGTGKTVVSFLAMYANFYRGDQGAIMAPTDALARQHYRTALKFFEGLKVHIALLVGSQSQKEKNEIYRALEEGDIDIIIGTHALFTKKVKYRSLGLVVIDEQHRFGVNQRQALLDKGDSADLLMMSATPIPRSLALTLYGDLDITTLDTYPNIERNVATRIIDSEDKRIYDIIFKALDRNQKVYIVAPLIHVKEERNSALTLFNKYQKIYKDKVGLLHGEMKAEEKEEALERFASGEKPILVSTQVIEVGIDVKSATVMIIYDAPNFGLASLHQLRGRIGRDGSKSICLLLCDKKNEEGREKISILEKTFNGFVIAEEDMKSRGPGDLTGLRQSGLPNFAYLNIIDDVKIFVTASKDAEYILKNKGEKQFDYVIKRAKQLIEYKEIIKA